MDAYEQLLWIHDTFEMPLEYARPQYLLNCQNLATHDSPDEIARVATHLSTVMQVGILASSAGNQQLHTHCTTRLTEG